MKSEKILIVEDEAAIREMVAFQLANAGYEVLEAQDCKGARRLLADERPALALIDWMLPDMSGLELTRQLRRDRDFDEVAIIMLTARSEERDMISGLDGGADDYVTKPFSPRELLARIRAVMRRAAAVTDERIIARPIEIDAAAHRVLIAGNEVHLGPTEYRLLKYLMSHPDRVYSRSQLLDRVWGANVYVEERTVDVHVRRLRKVLAAHGVDGFIRTVRGAGYSFSVTAVAG